MKAGEITPDDPRRCTYLGMLRLATTFGYPDFPPPAGIDGIAMQLAICWEESTWLNIPQVTDSGKVDPKLAVGFGQTEPSALQLIINRYKMGIKVEDYQRLCGAPAFAMNVVGRLLATLWQNLKGESDEHLKKGEISKVITPATMPMAVLKGFAADSGGSRKVLIDAWLACAAKLSRKTQTVGEFSIPSRGDIADGLWAGLPVGTVDGRDINRRPTREVFDNLMNYVLAGVP
jgi:hypothetical protein